MANEGRRSSSRVAEKRCRSRSKGPKRGSSKANFNQDDEDQTKARITQEDVDDVCISYERNKVGDWFAHLITSYKGTGEESGKDLKDAILNDLMAWSVLGSFLSAIAFESLFETMKVDKGERLELITEFWHTWQQTGDLWSAMRVLWWKHLYQSTDWCFTCLFMYAATSSLKGVICGTFKYLMFVPCPPAHIGKALGAYIGNTITIKP